MPSLRDEFPRDGFFEGSPLPNHQGMAAARDFRSCCRREFGSEDVRASFLTLKPSDIENGGLAIASFAVPSHLKGQGLGRKLLNMLLKSCDAHGAVLTLEASEDSVDAHWLEEWYGRLGFDLHDAGYGEYGSYMVREPVLSPEPSMS